ncbi:MAG: Na+/H+ antiporter subunit C [Candidatus Aegiribacteria sp.]|nr:Na+/H+ antiporter subunit C [Candidatus Aegiribacteria sp.]MBD3295414.1 Na+/H+ antiporter subunit C [Candidatus Fermentibacteria bacterium]
MAWYLIGMIFLLGLWGIMHKSNMVKKVMGLSIANSAIILFFIYHGSLSGDTAPIEGSENVMVDPVPQAMMLTAIVVGVCVMALALVLIYRLYLKFGTLDMKEIESKSWKL